MSLFFLSNDWQFRIGKNSILMKQIVLNDNFYSLNFTFQANLSKFEVNHYRFYPLPSKTNQVQHHGARDIVCHYDCTIRILFLIDWLRNSIGPWFAVVQVWRLRVRLFAEAILLVLDVAARATANAHRHLLAGHLRPFSAKSFRSGQLLFPSRNLVEPSWRRENPYRVHKQ